MLVKKAMENMILNIITINYFIIVYVPKKYILSFVTLKY